MQEIRDRLKSNDWNQLKDCLQEIAQLSFSRELGEILLDALRHKVWRVRKRAAEILSRNLPVVFSSLTKALLDKNPHTRYWCIQILGGAGARATQHLIDAYEHFSHEDRVFCLRAISRLMDPAAVPFAVQELNSSLWSLRQEAAAVLLELKGDAVPALKELLRNGSDNQRFWAFKLIGSIIQEKAIPTLQHILFSSDYEEKIRSYALSGLKEIDSDQAIPILIKTLDCNLWSLRAQASKILIQSSRDCIRPLIDALLGDSRPSRYWASQILVEKVQEKHLGHLDSCLTHQDPEIRFQAISIVGRVQTVSAVTALLPGLNDPIWYLRKHACDVICQAGSISIQPLLQHLRKAGEEELFWICRALGRLGHESSLRGLESLMAHEAKDVRLQALEAIHQIGGDGATHALLKAFDNEFWVVRSRASDKLLQGGETTVLPLLRCVHSPSESQSYWVQKTLEEFALPGVSAIVQILLEAGSKDSALILEQLAQLRPGVLSQLYHRYDLQRYHIVEQLTLTQNLNPSALLMHPQRGNSLEFHPVLRSDFSHEQGARFQEILKEFDALNGTQLHLSVGSSPMARVNGILCKCTNHKLSSIDIQEFLAPALSSEDLQTFHHSGQIEITLPLNQLENHRVHLSRTIHGLEATIHRVRSTIPDFETLGLPSVFLEGVVKLPRGLVLVSGPSSSGKSMTILSMLAYINRHFTKSIVTLEDRVEYPLQNEKSIISQKQIGQCFSDYESAVHNLSRLDADIIYCARMPDFPASETLLHMAASRSLVFVETNASITRDALEKILAGFPDMQTGIYAKLFQRSLVASLNLRLVHASEDARMLPAVEYFMNNSVFQSCLHMQGLDQLSQHLRDSNTESAVSLDDCLLQMASENRISYQEAMRFMEDKSRISISQIW